MSSYSVNEILAEAYRVLECTNPAFDITVAEREIACEHAKMMCACFAECKGDKKKFVQAMAGMVGTVQEFLHRGREQLGGEPGEFEETSQTDWNRQERETAIERFDYQFGVTWRTLQIQQAVNFACYMVLQEEDTFPGG